MKIIFEIAGKPVGKERPRHNMASPNDVRFACEKGTHLITLRQSRESSLRALLTSSLMP